MITEAFVLTCDLCGVHRAYDARYFRPQDALVEAELRHGWTIFDERSHCDTCPPLCGGCGEMLIEEHKLWCRYDQPTDPTTGLRVNLFDDGQG